MMPLAVVFDDRTDVWEPSSRHHVVQMLPFNYYRDEGQKQAGVPTQVRERESVVTHV